MKSCLSSQTGSALVTGMIAALSVGMVSALIMQQSQVTEKQTRAPRVKSAMIQVETQVRTLAFEPSVYNVCPPGSPAGCEVVLDTSSFSSLSKEIPGAKCPGTGFCGVEVTNPVFVSATSTFTADVVYTGQEVSLAPIRITASVPTAIWKSDGFAGCSETSPIFMGVDSSGNPVCGNLPTNCGAGRYLRGVDPMRLTTSGAFTCSDLPSTASCPVGQYIASVGWNANMSAVQVGCLPQKSPFLVASIGGDPTSYNYSGDPNYSVPAYPTPGTGCWQYLGQEDGSCSPGIPGGLPEGQPCTPIGDVGCKQMGISRRNYECRATCTPPAAGCWGNVVAPIGRVNPSARCTMTGACSPQGATGTTACEEGPLGNRTLGDGYQISCIPDTGPGTGIIANGGCARASTIVPGLCHKVVRLTTGPGPNCTAMPVADNCMGPCTAGDPVIRPFEGCANYGCFCECNPGPPVNACSNWCNSTYDVSGVSTGTYMSPNGCAVYRITTGITEYVDCP